MIADDLIQTLRVDPGEKARLKKRETGWAFTEELKEAGKGEIKERARAILEQSRTELADAQDIFFAAGTHALLVVLQAMDTAGKDGTIKHVMTGINPQGCRVDSFKQPTAEELVHDFLWRYSRRLPARGMIGIFNRSYYEEVLVVRVHPELLGPDRPTKDKKLGDLWKSRYEAINAFERHLANNRTVVLKFFLHISKEEQRQRLLARLDDPAKHWKFSPADVAERAYWDDYQAAYEDALTATSTVEAPWYVVPADHKWVARTVVADVLARTLHSLALRYPEVSPERQAALVQARRQLEQK
jgi:PPK2 family polyphosphate:nucleotide phosphotransferase